MAAPAWTRSMRRACRGRAGEAESGRQAERDDSGRRPHERRRTPRPPRNGCLGSVGALQLGACPSTRSIQRESASLEEVDFGRITASRLPWSGGQHVHRRRGNGHKTAGTLNQGAPRGLHAGGPPLAAHRNCPKGVD